METVTALKQAEGQLLLVADKIRAFSAKLEDLVFRAQRIAASRKNGVKPMDTMYSYDLQNFRRDMRTFSNEVAALPSIVNGIERMARFDERCVKPASSVWRACGRLNSALATLRDQACLAHSHIRESDARIEAWYIVQETEQLADKGKMLPEAANKILIRVSTPEAPPK